MRKTPRPESRPPSRRTRQERSAGVLLFRDDPAGRLFLLLDYGPYWDFPKGHVEQGEDDLSAARRELAEETGICNIRFLPGFAREIVYHFRSPAGRLVRKTVVFFLAQTDEHRVQISHEHHGHAWAIAPDALRMLKYPTARRVLRQALECLSPTPPEPPP